MDTTKQIKDLEEQVARLRADLEALNNEFYKNNFSSHQDFSKYSNFTSALKVPHYASVPSVCQVGEIIENAGKLLICSATNTWTICGTQS